MANNGDPDEIKHNAAFNQGLHCLLSLKQPSGTETHYELEKSTFITLKYAMCRPIVIVPIYMKKSFEYKGLMVFCFHKCIFACLCLMHLSHGAIGWFVICDYCFS